jgi:hypothetical protein
MDQQLSDTLVSTLSSHLDLSKSRLTTMAWLVLGMVNARTVNLSHIASQFSGPAQVSSSYRRLQRFFQFVALDGDWLARCVVKMLTINSPWILCLDRTNWKVGRRDVNILMLAITTRRRRIPLMWTVLDKAGASSQDECISLMARYLALFGPGSITWLLADREFIGGRWIKYLLKNNVLFAIRMRGKNIVRLENGRRYRLDTLLRRPAAAKLLRNLSGRLQAMEKEPGEKGLGEKEDFPLRFAAKRLTNGQLLIIASNGPAKKALNAYRRRWQIECLFGDSKTRGLNMEDTRLTNPAKLNSLLVIITLAMAWAYACATEIMGVKSIKTRGHGYRYKSWFRLGFDYLRKWIIHDPEKAADIWKRRWPKHKNTLRIGRVV